MFLRLVAVEDGCKNYRGLKGGTLKGRSKWTNITCTNQRMVAACVRSIIQVCYMNTIGSSNFVLGHFWFGFAVYHLQWGGWYVGVL